MKKKHVSKSAFNYAAAEPMNSLLTTVAELGIEVAALMQRAEIPRALQATNDLHHLSRDQATALYRECCITLEMHANFGRTEKIVEINEYNMLLTLLTCCPTLAAAGETLTEFFAMLRRNTPPMLTVNGQMAEFHLNPVYQIRGASSFLTDLMGLFSFHRLFGWLIGEKIPLQLVGLSYPKTYKRFVFMDFFGQDLSYGKRSNMLVFPAALLQRPVIRNSRELNRLILSFPFDLVPPDYDDQPFTEHVSNIILSGIVSEERVPSMQEIVRMMGMSYSTFRRRLLEEGVSYNTLREKCRREVAEHLLSTSSLTIGEISEKVGFVNPRVFGRVFKKWLGKAPSAFRDEILRGPPPAS